MSESIELARPVRALRQGHPGRPRAPEQPRTCRCTGFIDANRTNPGPFDIVAGGPQRGQNPDRTREPIRQSAQAGATWFSEWIPPGDPAAMRAAIARGPIRTGPA